MKIKASETRKGEYFVPVLSVVCCSVSKTLVLHHCHERKNLFSFSAFFSAWTLHFLFLFFTFINMDLYNCHANNYIFFLFFTFINMDLHNCHANNYIFFSCVLFCLHSFFRFTWLVLCFFLFLLPPPPPPPRRVPPLRNTCMLSLYVQVQNAFMHNKPTPL